MVFLASWLDFIKIYKVCQLFLDERDPGGDPVVFVGVAIGDAYLEGGADPGEEVDFHLIVGLLG